MLFLVSYKAAFRFPSSSNFHFTPCNTTTHRTKIPSLLPAAEVLGKMRAMMKSNFEIRYSPFLFLKRLALLEFLFALLPAVIALLLDVEVVYSQSGLARTLSFPVLWLVVITAVQVFLIGVVFFWWYAPSYAVSIEKIVWNRGSLFEPKELARTYAITYIAVHQGALGRRLDYGDLILHTSDQREPVVMQYIPNPERYRRWLEDMIVPELTVQAVPMERSAHELIAAGENQNVEFKASLQWDYRQQKRNKDLYEPVIKNLAAFMNTAGGALLIGVDDDGAVLGLGPDYETMGKKNSDGFENVFNMAFNKMIGPEYRRYVQVEFPRLEDKEVCLISVTPSPEPVFFTDKGEEKFYIRTGNTSQPLTISRASRYIQGRFGT
jgi:hypothetical protein